MSESSMREQMSSLQTETYLSNVSDSYLIIKRVIDLIGATCILILTAPIFIVISLLYLSGKNKGPIFFKQLRVGKNGQLFYIYKFRSMVVNAEQVLKNNKELYKKYKKSNYKLEPSEDPRITSTGRFLRKTSLDELPQLINVLKGEMSLIGPRPVVQEELVEYGNRTNVFLSVQPGLTGYWQAYGRSNVGYPERVDIELFYIYNQSLLLDIKIFFKTIFSVLLSKGAY